MEPLLDLSPLEHWRSYNPSTAGYSVEAPQEELRNAGITELFSSLEDLEGDRTLAGYFLLQNAPSPGILVDSETVPLPLSAPLYAKLAEGVSKIGETPIHQLGEGKVQVSNPAWDGCLKKGVKGAVAGMTANAGRFTCKQGDMVVITEDCSHALELRQVCHDHFATALVIMPSDQTSVVITLEAHHKHLAYRKDIKADRFATQFVTLYTGIDRAVLKVSGGPICYLTYHILSGSDTGATLRNLAGPRKEISTAFAAWQLAAKGGSNEKTEDVPKHILYQLDGDYTREDFSVKHLNHPKDKVVLGHVGPPAKQYGFHILLARISIHQKASRRASNGSDDEGCEGYTPDDLSLMDDDDGDPEYEWKFTSLIGEPVEVGHELENRLFDEIGRKESIYNCRIDLEDETGKDSEVDRDGDREYSYFSIGYHKRASFFFIVPEKRVYVGLRDPSPPRSRTAQKTRSIGPTVYERIKAMREGERGQKRQRMW